MKNNRISMFTQTNITSTNGFTWRNITIKNGFTWKNGTSTNNFENGFTKTGGITNRYNTRQLRDIF